MQRNPDIELLKRRAEIVVTMRAFFAKMGFLEVETPVRIAAPAPEPHIDCPEVMPPRSGGARSYLRASPELQMKKLLAAGLDRIYQIGPCFRDGENGARHRPEFTMVEWYRRDAGYLDIMDDIESLFGWFAALPYWGGEPPPFGHGPFKRVTVRDAYARWADWDPWDEWDQDRFDNDMAMKIEQALKDEGAVFLMDYPPQAASLAKLRGDVAERWELYLDGIELANCFTELCDPNEQRRRFETARKERRRLDEADYPIDEDFLASLESIGSAAGVALGVDRLVMVLLGAEDICQVRASM